MDKFFISKNGTLGIYTACEDGEYTVRTADVYTVEITVHNFKVKAECNVVISQRTPFQPLLWLFRRPAEWWGLLEMALPITQGMAEIRGAGCVAQMKRSRHCYSSIETAATALRYFQRYDLKTYSLINNLEFLASNHYPWERFGIYGTTLGYFPEDCIEESDPHRIAELIEGGWDHEN